MANCKNGLSAANIKYLLAMYRLYMANCTIRCVKIATALGVTKTSVHIMLNSLQKMALVTKSYRSEVFFTEAGLRLAEKFNSCYDTLHGILGKALSNQTDVCAASCAALGELSEQSLSQLCVKKHLR